MYLVWAAYMVERVIEMLGQVILVKWVNSDLIKLWVLIKANFNN